jgi:hypothetical protein
LSEPHPKSLGVDGGDRVEGGVGRAMGGSPESIAVSAEEWEEEAGLGCDGV